MAYRLGLHCFTPLGRSKSLCVDRTLTAAVLAGLTMVICHPAKQGGWRLLIGFTCENHSKHSSRNSLWPEVSLKAWRILDLEESVVLLKQLNSIFMPSMNIAVCMASAGSLPRLDSVHIPAATEWLRTWAASLTLRGAAGGRLMCLAVSLGAIRICNWLSRW